MSEPSQLLRLLQSPSDLEAKRRRDLIERTWLALVAGRQGPAHMLTLDHEMATLFAVAVDLVDDFLVREKALP